MRGIQEAQSPEKTILSAIDKVIWRILISCISALSIITSLVAWNRLDSNDSPFVVVLDRVSIPAAAGIVNFVVLTAALSLCNRGIFSTGPILYTLASFRQAPAALRRVSRQKVPAVGLVVSFSVMLVGVVINHFIPERASPTSRASPRSAGSSCGGWWVLSHLRYVRRLAEQVPARRSPPIPACTGAQRKGRRDRLRARRGVLRVGSAGGRPVGGSSGAQLSEACG